MKVRKLTARVQDINGWFEIKENPLSKVGVFPYLGSTIDRDGSMGLDPDKIYQVYRPAKELQDKECIDSFKLLPWINDHEMLGGELTPAEKKGVEGVIGEDVFFDDSDQTLKGNIKVFSENLKSSIDYGKEELSCGYRCKYERESGNFDGTRYDVIQRTIRGNHLALVEQGRMGPEVAVLDKAEVFTFTIDSKEFRMDPEKKEGETAEDMSPAEVTTALKDIMSQLAALSEAMAEMKKPAEDMKEEEGAEDAGGNGPSKDAEDKGDEESSGMDSLADENKELKSQVEKLQTSMDSLEKDGMKNLMSQISKRDALASSLSEHVGTFDHSEMTLGDVAKYGVDKLELTCDSGQEVAVLNGFLHQRKPAAQGHGMDSSASSSAIDSYLNGERS